MQRRVQIPKTMTRQRVAVNTKGQALFIFSDSADKVEGSILHESGLEMSQLGG